MHISLAANLSCVTGGRGKSSGVIEPVRSDSWVRPGTDITLQLHLWTHFLQPVEQLSSQPHKVYLDRWPLRSCEETKQTNKIWEPESLGRLITTFFDSVAPCELWTQAMFWVKPDLDTNLLLRSYIPPHSLPYSLSPSNLAAWSCISTHRQEEEEAEGLQDATTFSWHQFERWQIWTTVHAVKQHSMTYGKILVFLFIGSDPMRHIWDSTNFYSS